jgi:uncharacterized protein (TIGR03084 family)
MAVDMAVLLTDLEAETGVVDDMVAGLDAPAWDRATPAAGWAIRDQISHLAYFDAAAVVSARDPERFRAEAAALQAIGDGFPDVVAEQHRHLSPEQLLQWFRTDRRELVATFASLDPALRVPWYGPDMSAASALTARLMETWAHGQDIADALDIRREPAAGLRHIAHLGVRTFAFSFRQRGLDVPDAPVRVELVGPGGASWVWGEADAGDRISGPAEHFCLVVTQRRHVAETELVVHGPVAAQWMSIAQAYAGTPAPGRPAPAAAAQGGRYG